MTSISIDNIHIGARCRKDLGDIRNLAKSIKEIGLLHPVTIDGNSALICGYRRIAAYKLLGRTEIPAYVLNLHNIRTGELAENTQRKAFTFSEMIEIKKSLVQLERTEAIERQKEGQKLDGISHHMHHTDTKKHGGNLPPSNNELTKGKTRDKIAQHFGFSYKTLDNVEKIYDAAKLNPQKFGDLMHKLDEGHLRPHKAYRELQNRILREEMFDKSFGDIACKDENVELFEGDFRYASDRIQDNSIDLIYTDPPYDERSVPLYQDLAKLAARVLKDKASIVTYAPNAFIPTIISYMMNSSLTYWWTIAVLLEGSFGRQYYRQISIKFKPLLWFIKGDKLSTVDFLSDAIKSARPPKALHDWEQSLVEAENVISRLTVTNQTVFDPLMGSGTTGAAAIKLGRKFVGIEIASNKFELAKARIRNINYPNQLPEAAQEGNTKTSFDKFQL